jgi:hypothetical protein
MKQTKKRKKQLQYVIDMRHDLTSDSTYAVRDSYEEALKVAGDFWRDYDGEFDASSSEPFKVGEGYDCTGFEVTRDSKKRITYVSYEGGTFIAIKVAK